MNIRITAKIGDEIVGLLTVPEQEQHTAFASFVWSVYGPYRGDGNRLADDAPEITFTCTPVVSHSS